MAPNDAPSEELREACSNACSFSSNPSNCWDHCIKAVEALLKPTVMPNMPEATLGHIVGELTANPGKHPFTSRDHGLNHLTDPHVPPDRHHGSSHHTSVRRRRREMCLQRLSPEVSGPVRA